MAQRFIMTLASLVLSGCASQIPVSIESRPNPDLEFHQVKQNVEAFQNQQVRWGGKIISVENKEDSTWIEILANPLNSYGEPGSNTDYEGRFIARIDGFLDPEHYTKDRKLTIFGTVETEFVKRIDDHPYSYPLVSAKVYYLWPEYRAVQYQYYDPYYYHHGYGRGYSYGYYDPFFHDPFWFHHQRRRHFRFHHW
ncbi:MAG: outer membrane lipoprotein [Gammaproteobacteria bacterium]|jgi:outer membrane lipoprotein